MATTISSNLPTFGMTSTDDPLTVSTGVTIYSNYFANGVYTDTSLKHWTITNAGTIKGASIGIHVDGAIDLTNASSGLISGADFGVQSYNGYNYASHILNQGTIRGGTFGYGLQLPSGGTVVNSGTAALVSSSDGGIFLGHHGVVDNGGTIQASHYAAVFLYGAGRVTNAPGARIQGGNEAVLAKLRAIIVNRGTLVGTIAQGIYLERGGRVKNLGHNAVIEGHTQAIYAHHGNTSITNSGSINASHGTAVDLANGGTVVNAASGRITAPDNAVRANGAPLTLTNYGTLAASTYNGVFFLAGGTVSNLGRAAHITGGAFGIWDHGGDAGVTNQGTITGMANDGIRFDGAGTLNNASRHALVLGSTDGVYAAQAASIINQGSIRGYTDGIALPSGLVDNRHGASISGDSRGIGATGSGDLTVINAGTIISLSKGIYTNSGGLSLTNSGLISADIVAVYGYKFAAVSNAGTIIAGNGDGLRSHGLGDITNASSGLISGYTTAISLAGADSTVVNRGTITTNGAYATAISLAGNGNTVVNHGIITTTNLYAKAISVAGTGTVVNSGSIHASTDAVTLTSGVVRNLAGGAITGGSRAIHASANATIVNAGLLHGGTNGVYAGGDVLLTNKAGGTVSGVTAVYGKHGASAANAGRIDGSGWGIFASAGDVSLDNTGSISGAFIAVYAYDNASVANAGTIFSSGGTAIGAQGAADITNAATGLITGGEWGIYIAPIAGASTVVNHGTISGSAISGGAVHLPDADGNRFTTFRDAVTNGIVVGGTLSDDLAFGASPGRFGTIAGLGSHYTGFEAISLDPNARWILPGTASLPVDTINIGAGATLRAHGALAVTVDLTLAGPGTLDLGHGRLEVGTGGRAKAGELVVDATHTLQSTAALDAARARNFGSILNSSLHFTGDAAVTNRGVITGPGQSVLIDGVGTVLNTGSIHGDTDGVAFAFGSVDNRAGATIDAGGHAIRAIGLDATVTNAGLLHGGLNAIWTNRHITLANTATGVITGDIPVWANYGISANNAGAILGTTKGVYANNGGLILTNSGTISGATQGVYGCQYAIVSNSGTILGTTDKAIVSHTWANVSNASGGLISGYHYGIEADNTGSTVTNAGTIDGTAAASGIGLALHAGTIANAATGRIHGGATGIDGKGAITLANRGTIAGDSNAGVHLESGGTIANLGTAASIDAGFAGIYANDVAVTVTNQGTIHGASRAGIQLKAGGSVTNSGTASALLGGLYGVYISNGTGTVSNQGTIHGNAHALILSNGGTVTNLGTAAAILGGLYGVFTFSTGAAATITNAGSIAGAANGGIYLGHGGTITNLGTAASITGGHAGIVGWNVAPGIVNQGTIAGASGYGIAFNAGGTIINQGPAARIQGGLYGIDAHFDTTGGTTIVNHGLITGGGGAIRFGNANGNLLDLFPGAIESGAVRGGAGSDTLELSKGPGGGNLTGLGSLFTGFDTLTVDAGAKWHLAGANPADTLTEIDVAAGAQILVSGTLTTAGDLTLASPGQLSVVGAGRVEIGAGGLAHAGQVMIDAANTLTASGTIDASTVRVAGTLTVADDLTLQGDVSGNGRISINPNTVLTVTGVLGIRDIFFLPGGPQTVALDTGASSAFHGFTHHDTIDLIGLGGFVSKSYDPATHLLAITGSIGSTSLLFAGTHVDADFLVASNGSDLLVTHAP